MRIFYDFEFIETGSRITPISVGMVAEDGRTLYLINSDILYDEDDSPSIANHAFLMEHVMPKLPLPKDFCVKQPVSEPLGITASGRFALDLTDHRVVPKIVMRNFVYRFIADTPDPELWAWYGAFDHVTLAWLFGPMSAMPRPIPFWTNDARQELQRLQRRYGVTESQLPAQDPETLHHALHDAFQLQRVVLTLERLELEAQLRTGERTADRDATAIIPRIS